MAEEEPWLGLAKSAPTTIAGMLSRAVAIGVELRRIERDPMLHFLSHEAWLAHAQALAGTDLDELRARIADRPHLLATIDQTATVWLRGSQDRPALAHILNDPDREPGAFSERLAAGVSVAEASGLVAARYAEMAPQGRWGASRDGRISTIWCGPCTPSSRCSTASSPRTPYCRIWPGSLVDLTCSSTVSACRSSRARWLTSQPDWPSWRSRHRPALPWRPEPCR